MFFINLKIAFRGILRSKLYSILSLLSLSLGFIGFIFMILYSHYEKSYENWIPNNKNIYRIDQQINAANQLTENTPAILANTVANEIPEIKLATALQKFDFDMPFYSGMDNSYSFKNFYGVDSSFLKMFPFQLKYGSFKDFYTPQQIIISEKVSNAFFGDENPVGKTISMGFNTDLDFTVAGVLSESGPSHLNIEAISYYTLSSVPNNWGTLSYMPFTTYIELTNKADILTSTAKIKNLYQKKLDKDAASLVIILEPINDIHLSSLITGNANLKFLLAILFLSGLLLIISCLNFINLLIAKSSIRNKEFAIKKLLGTTRPSLIKQFLSETFLQTIISFALAVGLLYLLMPYLEKIVGLNENLLASISKPIIITQLIGLILIISIITGLYPAILISGKKVSSFLKGNSSSGKGNTAFRSVLLVFQFTLSIGFIISLTFINKQIDYMKNKELGFDPDKVVSITSLSPYQTPASFNSDKIKLLEIPGVESATVTSDVPGKAIKSSINLNLQGKDFTLKSIKVDFDYFKTLDIKILKGREFSPAFARDSSHSVILNQTALQLINLEDPIGKTVKLEDSLSYKIVGVCADFLNNGFIETNPPIAFTMTRPGKADNFGSTTSGTFRSTILLKAQTGQISETIKNIKTLWPSLSPMDPQLRYSFLDSDYEKLFIQSEQLSKLFKIVSYLSLFISLIGLFGLSSYILNQRKKELSIRKVIGASVYDIFLLVNNHYVKLVLISTLFACILSYFFVKNWLTDYAYQTNLNAGIFVLVAIIILFLTVLTITVQSYKTILESPVKHLKEE